MKKTVIGISIFVLFLVLFAGSYGPGFPTKLYRFDTNTHSMVILDYAHNQIHDGNHYKAGFQDDSMNTDEVVSLVFTTPNSTTYMHWTLTAQSTGKCRVALYSGPTLSAPGTSITPTNRNFNSSKTSAMVVRHTPGISANGTKITERWIGASGIGGTTTGGSQRGDSEFILAANTQYLLLGTAEDDAIKIAIGGDWYEHANF